MKTHILIGTIAMMTCFGTSQSIAQVRTMETEIPAIEYMDETPLLEGVYELKISRIAELSAQLSTSDNKESVQNEINQLQEQALSLRADLKNIRLAQVESEQARNQSIEKYNFDPHRDDLNVKNFNYSYEPVKGTLFVSFSTKKNGQGEVRILTPGSVLIDAEAINDGNEVSLELDLSNSNLELFFINIERNGKMVTKKVQLS